MKIKSGINLWASGALFVFAIFTTFGFWMSPLGLGFDQTAVDKLNTPFIHEAFMGLFWLGPIGLILTALGFLYVGFSKKKNANYKNTIFFGTLAIIISQISMLTYLSI